MLWRTPEMEGKGASQETSRERWARVSEILYQALALAPEARAAYLDSACGDDSGMRAEVESLLDAAARPGLIDRPVSPSALAAASDPALSAGESVGPYQVLEELGQGGMGVVYKALDTRLGRVVALKVLPHTDVSALERSRFRREAKSASAFNDPRIVSIYEYDSTGDLDYIAMEYVAGRTLHCVLAATRPPLRILLGYARQVAGALAKAHQAGIVHRDLKPGNVMVTDEGAVKILDFGLAKIAADGEQNRETTETQALTKAGMVLGTPSYMSPEQARGEPADWRSDIFCFGIILYEIVGGRRPFQGQNAHATLHQIASVDPPSVSTVNRSAPRDLAKLIERCLKKEKEERLQSMAEAEQMLAAMLETDVRPWRLPSPSRRSMLAAGLPLLAVGAAGIWYARKPGSPSGPGLVCTLDAQPLREGEAAGEAHTVQPGEVFRGSWHFRLRAQPGESGFLYLVDDGPDQTGVDRITVLYPPAGTSASVQAGSSLETKWYRLEGEGSAEQLWAVWSKTPAQQLEASLAAVGNGPVLDPDATKGIRSLLKELRYSIVTTQPAGTIELRGAGNALAALIELRRQ